MTLFFGNLPMSASVPALIRLLHLPESAGRSRLRIIKKRAVDGAMIRYALYQTASESEARKLMARSGRVALDGQPIFIREFSRRVANNDRRAPDWRERPWPHAERRVSDRRQPERPASAAA